MSDRGGPARLGRGAVWGVAAGFWLFVLAVTIAQIAWIAQTPGQRMNLAEAIDWQIAYLLPWIPCTIAVWHITRGWLPERFGGWPRLLLAHIALAAAIALVHTFLVTVLARTLSSEEAKLGMLELMGRQLRGQLNALLLIYTAIAGTGASMTLYERYQDRQVSAARLEAELAAARLQALRGHLQPHFLFNSLHSIAALARAGDTAGVVRLIAALSDLLRHVLDAGDRHASLREELEIVERYLQIQRVRFTDRLSVTIDLAADVADARVPLLIVQPLVENAMRHGLAPRVREGSLVVRAARDNGFTRIVVEDTGVGLPPGWRLPGATGTGLRNLSARLAAEFGDTAALDVSPREGGGVRATVTLPYVSASASALTSTSASTSPS
jgi:two-component system, LytTR family, sensor kinase